MVPKAWHLGMHILVPYLHHCLQSPDPSLLGSTLDSKLYCCHSYNSILTPTFVSSTVAYFIGRCCYNRRPSVRQPSLT